MPWDLHHGIPRDKSGTTKARPLSLGGGARTPSGIRQDDVMRLDHISYACHSNELADVVQRIGVDLGNTFIDGGRHPSFGTRNFILPLAHGVYIEVVSALGHPSAQKAPFGRAVAQRAQAGGGWMSWVVSTTDLSPVEQELGRKAAEGHRIRPDGVDLHWRQIGVLDTIEHPQSRSSCNGRAHKNTIPHLVVKLPASRCSAWKLIAPPKI